MNIYVKIFRKITFIFNVFMGSYVKIFMKLVLISIRNYAKGFINLTLIFEKFYWNLCKSLHEININSRTFSVEIMSKPL